MDEIKLESQFINSIVEKILGSVLKEKTSHLVGCKVHKVYLQTLDGIMQGDLKITIIRDEQWSNFFIKALNISVIKKTITKLISRKYEFIEKIDIKDVSIVEKNGSYLRLNLKPKLKETELISFLDKLIQ